MKKYLYGFLVIVAVAGAGVLFHQHARLVKAEHELRELGARNLVIVDIFDDTSAGRVGAARVFYAEGKSLLFYAYDLPAGPYYVWGSNKDGSLRSLGALAQDGSLRIDDAKLLADIDQIFTNIEPRPQGKKILTAHLSSANGGSGGA